MTTPYTPEERERAALMICGTADGEAFFGRHPDLGYKIALALQLQANRLERREAEARELLNSYRRGDIEMVDAMVKLALLSPTESEEGV